MLQVIKYLIVLTALNLSAAVAYSAVFTVTNNADAGSGTLREALTLAAANGSAETDIIQFQLSTPVIGVITPLPPLTSNVIVDGTSQPGAKLGISDAKVEITLDPSVPYQTQNIGFFRGSNASNIEIYGFFFSLLANGFRGSSPINLKSCTNIKIGDAGKGNVFGAVEVDISLTSCDNIKVSANWFGLNPQQTGVLVTAFGRPLVFSMCDEIMVGGETVAEGNIFVGRYYGISISGYNPATGRVERKGNSCKLKNNRFGLNQFSGVSSANNIEDFKTVLIQANICHFSGGFYVERGDDVKVYGNRIGIDENQVKGASITTPLNFEECQKVVVGGSTDEESNILSHNSTFGYGIFAQRCGDVSIVGTSIYCVNYQMYYSLNSKVPLPEISVSSISSGIIKGKSTPNALIEVFSDGECNTCQAKTLTTRTYSDNAGNWEAPAPLGGFTASATVNNRTSLFHQVNLAISNIKTVDPTCGQSNGSIKGADITNATAIEWRNSSGTLVGTEADLVNVPAGTYTIVASIGTSCKTSTHSYTLKDTRPQLFTNRVTIKDASCGLQNGSITNISGNFGSFNLKSLTWRNQNGEIKGNLLNLTNVGAGTYTLTVESTEGCIETYGPILLQNSAGPNVNQLSVTTTGSRCGKSEGSITGMLATGTGVLTYKWKNEQGQEVASMRDLFNQPAGRYLLEVTDQSSCVPISSAEITIPELDGITIVDAGIVQPAGCLDDNGSITGIAVSGASTYQWYSGEGTLMFTTTGPELRAAPPGTYYLVASGNSCSKRTRNYIVTRQTHTTVYRDFTKVIKDATCGLDNGSINTIFISQLPPDLRWRWVKKSTGETVGNNSLLLEGVSDGSYQLYATDHSGCEVLVTEYPVGRKPGLKLLADNVQIIPDNCGLGTGAIRGGRAVGEGPFTYTWSDVAGKIIGTGANLTGLQAGTYNLNVQDAGGCAEFASYTVNSLTETISPPQVGNLQLCSPGEVFLTVSNTNPEYTYILYEDQNTSEPLREDVSGRFKVNVKNNRTFYISQRTGNCESERTEVSVTIGTASVNIPTAITPNGDGINDTWKIEGIEIYSRSSIEVFTRTGEKVFNSKGGARIFDGKWKGSLLPTGVYYYIVKLDPDCNPLSGSLTIVR